MTRRSLPLTLLLAALALGACGGDREGDGEAHRIRVPQGAPFSTVADSLDHYGIIGSATLFRLYARATGAASAVQAGTYEFRQGDGWRKVLDDLTHGRVAADRLVVPEGWEIRRIAPALAALVGGEADSLAAYMLDTATAARYQVPGPNLEGYLYPATYLVPVDADPERVIRTMVEEYRRRAWTPEHQQLAEAAGLSEREVITLASIVEKEAKIAAEMPRIAAVFLNRLEIGYPLQADPTVQYALGVHQNRLLYAHIDSVADNPYNTYRRGGLPPGPIGSPSARAVRAVLEPEDVDYLYFVARDDGSHVFTRHLSEHNEARARIQRERRAAQDSARRANEGPQARDTSPGS